MNPQGPGHHETRHRAATQPLRSKMGGWCLIVLAPIAAILLFRLSWPLLLRINDFRMLVMAVLLLVMGAVYLVKIGWRMRAMDGWELLRRDPRPAVVLLRAFQADGRMTYNRPMGVRVGGETVARAEKKAAAHDPKIAGAMRRIGPFLAVGKPGERLAPLGAARLYVHDDEWQQTVVSLVEKAAAVVLQPEMSRGAVWEVELVGQKVDPRRLLLLVPNPGLRPLAFARVRVLTAELLRIALPGDCLSCEAFMFDQDRKPVPLSLKRRPGRSLMPFVRQVQQLGSPE